jgi:hypothetical protein
MSKKAQRKKPGFTKAGVAKIVSMSVKQLVAELDRTQKKKVKAKIRNRMRILESRPGFVNPAEQSQPV